MAAHDAFLDEDAVSMLNSTNGRPTTIPLFGDIENVAQVISESTDNSSNESEHRCTEPSRIWRVQLPFAPLAHLY